MSTNAVAVVRREVAGHSCVSWDRTTDVAAHERSSECLTWPHSSEGPFRTRPCPVGRASRRVCCRPRSDGAFVEGERSGPSGCAGRFSGIHHRQLCAVCPAVHTSIRSGGREMEFGVCVRERKRQSDFKQTKLFKEKNRQKAYNMYSHKGIM